MADDKDFYLLLGPEEKILKISETSLKKIPYFSILLDSGMTESQTGRISIPDLSPALVERYINLRSATKGFSSASLSTIDIEECMELMLLADRWSDDVVVNAIERWFLVDTTPKKIRLILTRGVDLLKRSRLNILLSYALTGTEEGEIDNLRNIVSKLSDSILLEGVEENSTNVRLAAELLKRWCFLEDAPKMAIEEGMRQMDWVKLLECQISSSERREFLDLLPRGPSWLMRLVFPRLTQIVGSILHPADTNEKIIDLMNVDEEMFTLTKWSARYSRTGHVLEQITSDVLYNGTSTLIRIPRTAITLGRIVRGRENDHVEINFHQIKGDASLKWNSIGNALKTLGNASIAEGKIRSIPRNTTTLSSNIGTVASAKIFHGEGDWLKVSFYHELTGEERSYKDMGGACSGYGSIVVRLRLHVTSVIDNAESPKIMGVSLFLISARVSDDLWDAASSSFIIDQTDIVAPNPPFNPPPILVPPPMQPIVYGPPPNQ